MSPTTVVARVGHQWVESLKILEGGREKKTKVLKLMELSYLTPTYEVSGSNIVLS